MCLQSMLNIAHFLTEIRELSLISKDQYRIGMNFINTRLAQKGNSASLIYASYP